MAKQCICGRSKEYPICDGSHKIKVEPVVVESNANKESIRQYWDDQFERTNSEN